MALNREVDLAFVETVKAIKGGQFPKFEKREIGDYMIWAEPWNAHCISMFTEKGIGRRWAIDYRYEHTLAHFSKDGYCFVKDEWVRDSNVIANERTKFGVSVTLFKKCS